LLPAWSEDSSSVPVPIGQAAAASAASVAAATGDYKSLSLLVCNQRILAANVVEYPAAVPVVSRTVLVTAAQKYAATGECKHCSTKCHAK
jgi:hypothetical protein